MSQVNMPIQAQEQGLTWAEYMEGKHGSVDVAWTISMCTGSQALEVVSTVYSLMQHDGNEDQFDYALEKSWKFPEYYIPAFIYRNVTLLRDYQSQVTLPFKFETDEQNEDYLVWEGGE
jgi:hypothetical protein